MKSPHGIRILTPARVTGFALMILAGRVTATTHYVNVNSATPPSAPYTNWATATTNIQDAVDAAVVGDEIVVTNGIYALVVVDKSLTLRSINGPQFTTIDARQSGRCAHLTNSARLSGFTLSHGNAGSGGGPYEGGGAYGGTLDNCTISENSVHVYPNRGAGLGAGGGAAYCTLNNCLLTYNYAWGAYMGVGGGAVGCTLNNCTLTYNSARADAFPQTNGQGGGTYGCTLNNCIVYFNDAAVGANYVMCTLNYSCTTPLPTNGVGNIINAPLFVDQAAGNFRLQPNSPCINAGLNSLAPAGPDLDGNPRIAGGTVDMGAYEFQSAPSITPRLAIATSGSNVLLQWLNPTGSAWALQSTANLAPPVVWTLVSMACDARNVVTNPISATQEFYRLSPYGDCKLNADCFAETCVNGKCVSFAIRNDPPCSN